jgi:hypothetical protein
VAGPALWSVILKTEGWRFDPVPDHQSGDSLGLLISHGDLSNRVQT